MVALGDAAGDDADDARVPVVGGQDVGGARRQLEYLRLGGERMRVSTSRRSVLIASSSSLISRARAASRVSSSSRPASARWQAPRRVDPGRQRGSRPRQRPPRSGPRARPPSARQAGLRVEPRALRPRADQRRFSPASGTTSATVASATRSRSSSAARVRAGAVEQRLRQLVGDPGRAQVRARVAADRGWTIGASGSAPSARGAWWSVTTTSSPRRARRATSSTAVIAQSTVTSRSVPRAAGGRPSRPRGRSRRRSGSAGTSRRRRRACAAPGQHGGRAHAVDVVVAVDGDPRAAADVAQDPAAPSQAAELVERVRVVGGEERAARLRFAEAAPDQHLGEDVARPQLARSRRAAANSYGVQRETGIRERITRRSVSTRAPTGPRRRWRSGRRPARTPTKHTVAMPITRPGSPRAPSAGGCRAAGTEKRLMSRPKMTSRTARPGTRRRCRPRSGRGARS